MLGLSLAFAAGGLFGACKGTDANLEKEKLLRELEEAGPGGKAQCRPGDVSPCYEGPDKTAGFGGCKQGEKRCGDNAQWTECRGQVLPAAESCNLKDDDCDGIVDNNFEKDGAVCFIGSGSCKTQGVWHCAPDGTKAMCDAPPPTRAAEVCDGRDNDCNGQIDDGAMAGTGEACNTGRPGVCAQGTKRCAGGRIACMANQEADLEICNQKDDNCDGKVDNNCLTPEEAAQLKAQRGQQ
ncbi:MAG: MopE-related protein [Nannocystaceae bacterium]|nr:hypothetical protein [Myxococcales bacterium]